MTADGAPSTPRAYVSAPFYRIQSYGYTDQRKVEADVEVTGDQPGDLSLRKSRTSQLSRNCSFFNYKGDSYLPKHLLRFVALSIKTFALNTVPNGRNVCIKSASVNS